MPNAPHVLREYSVIADGVRGGVIGPRGDLAWLCFPSWESPTVFDSLVGGAAAYDVHPVEPYVWGGYYEDSTLIWRDRWVTSSGAIVECREALCFPGHLHRAVVLRTVRAIRGTARLRAFLSPTTDYGETAFRSWRQLESGAWTARSPQLRLRWSGTPAGMARRERAVGLTSEFVVREGEERHLLLELSDGALDDAPPDPSACWLATEAAWAESTPSCESTGAPRDARQAYAILRGLSSPGGGTVAAVTTSLPERAAQGRNYDYRYSWIRDQCFVGQAAAAAGEEPELLGASVRFVAERLLEDGPELAPAYTSRGGPVPGEQCLSFPGYPGGNAVTGNHASKQFQLDAFGEALALFAAAAGRGLLDSEGWRAAEVAVDAIAARWQQPDAGIWELENRKWTHSRLACVGGLRSICAAGAPASRIGPWTALADALLAETASSAIHPTGRWQRAPDDDRIDAALLLPPLRGATTADDPRTRLTLQAVRDALVSDGYVYRYRPDERPLGESEGAFQLCIFALSLASIHQGDTLAGVRAFERGRAACGPAGLFTEEYDVQERQLRGNLPQSFVHAIFLETAAAVGASLDEE
ncbi:MAG: glycoside hydrolase family 15 protein [Acidimicrobiales bacterium]